MPELWVNADLSERRRLVLAVLGAVYVDTQDATAGIEFTPKAVFGAVFAEAEYLDDRVHP